MSRTIKVGSRESELALIQSEIIINGLKAKFPQFNYEIVTIKTKGDKILDKTLSKIGGKGLFVKEIQMALLAKDIDIAVHSMKDMPQQVSEGLMISSMPEREDPRDILVFNKGSDLQSISPGGVIGTSSLRRQGQILRLKGDLLPKGLRGNVKTRIDKLYSEGMDGIILAAAGVNRLKLDLENYQYLDVNEFIPAVGQGAIGCEIRESDTELNEMLQTINHEDTYICVMAERSFLQTLEGGCHAPIACYGKIKDSKLHLIAMVGSSDGTKYIRDEIEGSPHDNLLLGKILGQRLAAKGAKELLKAEEGIKC